MVRKPGKDEKAHLHDILESARKVESYVAGQTFEEFWEDPKTRDAVAMRLNILGEAARHVSPATVTAIPAVPFHQLRGLRNRIAHTYDQVDFKEVWKITQQDLKPLISELEKYFGKETQPPGIAKKIQVTPTVSSRPARPGHGRAWECKKLVEKPGHGLGFFGHAALGRIRKMPIVAEKFSLDSTECSLRRRALHSRTGSNAAAGSQFEHVRT
jgi:uncharacterized protein with HEPN domain